jgi:hypothetical protein
VLAVRQSASPSPKYSTLKLPFTGGNRTYAIYSLTLTSLPFLVVILFLVVIPIKVW